MRNRLILLAYITAFVACAEKKAERSASVRNGAFDQKRNDPPPSEPSSPPAALASGLPDFCTAATLEPGHSCYRCSIEETAIERCVEGQGFDFASRCQHDGAKLRCQAQQKTHELDLKNPAELQIIRAAPMVAAAASVLVSTQLSDDSKEKAVITESIDFLRKNIKRFLSPAAEISALRDEVVAFASSQYGVLNKGEDGKPRPMSEESKLQLAQGTESVLAFFRERRLAGTLELGDGLELARQLSEAVPSLGIGEHLEKLDFSSSIDLNKILSQMRANSSAE